MCPALNHMFFSSTPHHLPVWFKKASKLQMQGGVMGFEGRETWDPLLNYVFIGHVFITRPLKWLPWVQWLFWTLVSCERWRSGISKMRVLRELSELKHIKRSGQELTSFLALRMMGTWMNFSLQVDSRTKGPFLEYGFGMFIFFLLKRFL